MKKTVFFVLAAMLVSTAFAQAYRNGAPNAPKTGGVEWHAISQHVTGANFLENGQTVSTEAIANSGKAMVIDFSATWCSWCYVMHQSGILEAIQDQLGDQVQCIWVEADPSTTDPGEITGSGSTQGDWTNGGTVPYPIINDYNFANIIGGTSVIDGFPTVVFVTPNGFWCDVYGTDWGFGPYSAADAVTAISALLNNMPSENDPPVINSIVMPTFVNSNTTANFNVDVFSPADYTVAWTFQGGNPATANTQSATCTWSTPGTYQVSVTVTNANGTATETANVTVASYAVFFDFEDANAYNGWTTIDADGDGQNWTLGYLRGNGAGHNGSNGMLASASYYNQRPLTPDNWIFTTAITVPNSGNPTLEWWEKGQDPNYAAEKYRVYVATEPTINAATEVAGFTATGDWKQRVVSLAAYKGQTVYIALRHYGVTDMFWLDIDDMGIAAEGQTAINDVNNVSIALYPNPVTDKLTVEVEGLREVNVIDLTGRTVATSTSNVVDVTSLSAGSYIVRVVTNSGIASKTFVKE